jgi:glycosyltransferase involved in cell wall biosynthesis
MRRLASGTVLYGYASVLPAKADLAHAPVWVAPNSLYFRSDIAVSNQKNRREILYVGRLEPAKKLPLLIHGFAQSGLHHQGYRLSIVGHGSQLEELRALARDLSLQDACDFVGRVYDTESIKQIYGRSVCSVSPGYAGLSLTQSVGFGVPVLVADDEPHSPEIELDRTGAVSYFTSDSPAALADALIKVCGVDHAEDSGGWSRTVASSYSAESMAQGLVAAYRNESQSLEEDGWPPNEI